MLSKPDANSKLNSHGTSVPSTSARVVTKEFSELRWSEVILASSSESEGPAQLNCDQVTLRFEVEIGAWDDLLPVPIPDNEEIIARLYRPAKAIVRADCV